MSFDAARFEALRAGRGLALGNPVSWNASTQSTNDDALAAAKGGAPHGALFGAETQARGRGRRGSVWLSQPGAGLWFSLVLRPRLRAELVPLLALCAGLAVREVVAARVTAPVLVKWPNDVLAGGLKVAGVLIESQVSGNQLGSAVVGIGLNVDQREFPVELSGVATSLVLLQAGVGEREALLVDLLAELELRVQRLETGHAAAISSEIRGHDALLGRSLRIDDKVGRGAGIDDAGRLLLETSSGRSEPISSGHVVLLD